MGDPSTTSAPAPGHARHHASVSGKTVFAVGAALLALVVGFLVLSGASGLHRDQTPLGRLLDYRGPVGRMVETQTDVGGSSALGEGRSRTVTTIARDERSALAVTVRTHTNRKGQVSTDRSEKQYLVSGPAGREVVTVTPQAEDYRSRTVKTFDGPCLIREVTEYDYTNQEFRDWRNSKSVRKQTCDAHGRTLKEVSWADGNKISHGTYWWLSSRLAFGTTWNSARGRSPARTYWGLLLLDQHGNSVLISSVISFRDAHKYDEHGNWIRRETKMTPVPLVGDDLYKREITYRDNSR